jgi:glycine cleavage system aminomethyltransferase T
LLSFKLDQSKKTNTDHSQFISVVVNQPQTEPKTGYRVEQKRAIGLARSSVISIPSHQSMALAAICTTIERMNSTKSHSRAKRDRLNEREERLCFFPFL